MEYSKSKRSFLWGFFFTRITPMTLRRHDKIHLSTLVESVPTKHSPLGVIVFVTGNAGKIDEVCQILAQGE